MRKIGMGWGRQFVKIGDGSGSFSEYNQEGESFSCSNAIGESVKYVSGVISRVDIENAFGTTQVYFTEVLLGYGLGLTEHLEV